MKRKDLIAKFICQKLYKYFISPKVENEIVNQLAATFVSNDFNLIPVYKLLFKSEHFFDTNSSNVLIKGPIDTFVFLQNDFEFDFPETFQSNYLNYIKNKCVEMGQEIFKPVDVAGWQERITIGSQRNLTTYEVNF